MTCVELFVLVIGQIYVAAAGFVVLAIGLYERDLDWFFAGAFMLAMAWGCLERYRRKLGG